MSEHQVLEALKVLYDSSSDASERAVVSNYLSSFQRSLLSWNVTLNLLSRQDTLPAVSQLFAAQTLKEKLRTQSFQLSQDSWQPVRSCIISVLQRPCETALETQACLCLVTVVILLSITDDSCVSQLKPLMSPLRLLRVLQLLAEEVAHDASPYELVPGVDKVAWWLQAQKGAMAMAPAVLGVVAEGLDTVREPKQSNDTSPMDSQANGDCEDTQLQPADGEHVLTRGLHCAAAWFKLGVLLTMPSSSYEGVVQAALHSAASPNSEVSTAACEALAEAFERCPDQLLTHMQPQILELTVFALDSSRVLTEDHQYQLLALVSTYVQSSADSLVAGGRSDLIQKLFAAASVHAQNGVGNMAAAHAVDALVATGRAMQVAVKEEMGSGALPAHLQGLLQVCCEGLVGLLQVLQDTLVACVEEPSQAHTTLLEELQECYAIIIPLVGATTICQALAQVQGLPADDSRSQGRRNDAPPIAAMLTALSSAPRALRSACKEASARSNPSASGSGSLPQQQHSSNLAQGLLQLMEQCRAQAAHSDTPEALSIAAHRALFAAVPVFSPLLICEVNTMFTAAAPMIAASALQVLRAFSAGRKNPNVAVRAPSTNQLVRNTSDDSTGGMESDRIHRMPDFQARRSSDRMHGDESEEGSMGMHVLHAPASVAMASLIAALQGSEKELTIVDETVAVVNAVRLPSQCDEKLLLAAFTASVQAGSAAHGNKNNHINPSALCQDSGLVGVAWRIVESVAHDAQQAVHQMAAHVQTRAATRQTRTSIDSTCMDSQPSAAAPNNSAGVSSEPGATGEPSELLKVSDVLLRHLNRAVSILGAARSKPMCNEDSVDSDADLIDCAECPQPPAVSLHLLSQLCSLVEPLAVVLSAPGVSATVSGPLRRVWGKATVHAVALDARAAESLLPCVFKVVNDAASVDVLVDWHDLLAAMMDAYLPRDAGFSQTAGRILTALQTIWTLSELQALPCPCEADMIPEVSVASSMLCIHVARSALTSSSCLSMESVCPLIEVGMARCSMAASASLRHVASAALSALLSMLSAAASLPERSLSPVAGCVLRGGGTMMMGFACALTAPGAGNRVTKLTQLLLQLAALVARAVPLLSQPPLVALHPTGLPLSVPAFPTSQPSQPRSNTPLSPAAVTQGVSYVLLWLKHALACLRPGMLQAHTPTSICAAWQPFLSQALLAGVPQAPVPLPGAAAPVATAPGAVWQAVVGHAFPGGVENSAALAVPSSAPATAPSMVPQQPGFVGSASPFVGLPAAATPMSLPPGASAWGSLGAGVRFGSALRADTPFAAQLTANMITASALTDHNGTPSPDSEAFHLNEALASPACRSLKKAVRAVVVSIGGRASSSAGHNVGELLSSSTPAVAAAAAAAGGIGTHNGMRTSTSPLSPAQQQAIAQQALCVPGGSVTQPVFPFVPHVVAGAVSPAQLHVPMGTPHLTQQPPLMHSVSPTTVAVAAAHGHAPQVTSSFNAPIFAPSAPAAAAAAPAAYFAAPAFPTPTAATPNISTLRTSDAQAIVQCSLAAGAAGAGHMGLSMAPLAQQLQAVAIAGPASNKAKPCLGMETDENAR